MTGTRDLVLVAVTVVAAAAWAVATVVDGSSPTQALPAATTVALAVGAVIERSRSGLPASATTTPPWFVPAVLLVASAGAVAWGLRDDPAAGARVGVAALVMASPAATILGAPLAFAVGASRARAHGVQLRDLDTVRATSRLDTLVLEKDGTVTTGDLTVVSVEPVEPDHDRNLRWFAGALEKASDHRVGRAVATLSARGQLSDVEVVDGLGIRGSVDRHPVRVGSPEWIGIDIRPTIWTTVGVEVDGRALGSITVADDVRPDLTRDVARLTALGLDLVLVSGDGDERTRHVAGLAGIDRFHAACDAARTGEVVTSLVADGLVVATAGTTPSDGATLAFTTPDEPVAGRPVIVVDDLAPARIADAVEAARATGWRVRRSGRVAVLLGAIGVAAALTGVAGAVVMAATAAGIAAVTAAVATSG